jgi:hypothetical protein
VRRQAESERATPCDSVGLNASQFSRELHKPCIIPFIRSLSDEPSHIYLAADGARWHQGPENAQIQRECGYLQLSWPPNSPDLNPIDNCWMLLKQRLRKRFLTRERRPHSIVELFEATQEELDLIDQGTIDKWIDEMPRRLQAVLAANGGHTKW